MRALFDVNVLLALSDPGHIHHGAAHAWWETHHAPGWASCPLTQNGFIRVSSQPKYPNAVTTAEAVLRLRQSVARSDHAFWPDDLALADEAVFKPELLVGPRQVTDVYLLALSVRHGGRLVTFDQNIPLGAVPGAEPRHVVVLAA